MRLQEFVRLEMPVEDVLEETSLVDRHAEPVLAVVATTNGHGRSRRYTLSERSLQRLEFVLIELEGRLDRGNEGEILLAPIALPAPPRVVVPLYEGVAVHRVQPVRRIQHRRLPRLRSCRRARSRLTPPTPPSSPTRSCTGEPGTTSTSSLTPSVDAFDQRTLSRRHRVAIASTAPTRARSTVRSGGAPSRRAQPAHASEC